MCETSSDFDKIRKEAKKRERKEWFYNKLNDISCWVKNNKEAIAIVAPAICVGAKGIVYIGKQVSRNRILNKERRLKELFVYDHSLGKYLELKKPLKSYQMKTILSRRENGEHLSTILYDMNLLK